MARRKRNIVRFPGIIHLNIGIVIFIFIAVYIAFNVYSFFTAVHVSTYEVEQGTIEVNTAYTGLIVREETVFYAQQNGILDYYLKEYTKASKGTLVCSVDENGNVSDKINAAADSEAVLSAENLNDVRTAIQDYVNNYQDENFYTTYNFKSDLSGQLLEIVNLSALEAISDYTDYAKSNQTFHLYHADQPGIVTYYTDGYESLSADAITADVFDPLGYKKSSTKSSGAAESGDPVYKMITSEEWQIVVPIDDVMWETLQDSDVIEISFREDHTSVWANYTLEKRGGVPFLILSLHNSMIRYAKERYIDIEILLEQQSGLKLPNSAITKKSFELVPNDYFVKGNASGQTGLMIEHKQQDGSYSEPEFIATTVYYQTEEMSYISQENIVIGDRVVLPGSSERYEITETDELQGVYNVNKGYAVFKQIDELYHNDEYTIVKPGTDYGITLYDHIALDGNSIEEGQMTNVK